MRKLIWAAVSAALFLGSAAPAAAQDYRFAGFDAPRGATATANLRIPLGREAKAKPSYGVTLGYGRASGAGIDGRTTTRAFRLADFRLSGEGRLSEARLAGFNLADPEAGRRMNLSGKGSTIWIVGGVVVAAAVACLVFCSDNDTNAVPLQN